MNTKNSNYVIIMVLMAMLLMANNSLPPQYRVVTPIDYLADQIFITSRNAIRVFEDSPAKFNFGFTQGTFDGGSSITLNDAATDSLTTPIDVSLYETRTLEISYNTTATASDNDIMNGYLTVDIRGHATIDGTDPKLLGKYILTNDFRTDSANSTEPYKSWSIDFSDKAYAPYVTILITSSAGENLTGFGVRVGGKS